LGDYFRRMRSKLGYNQAIIAVAHKLARIIYHMVKERVEYDESIDRAKNINMLEKKRNSLQKRLAKIEAELNLSACNTSNLVLVR
jgi:phage anti-repressor protein